jgi:lipid-binding SYLF domain-containing protein
MNPNRVLTWTVAVTLLSVTVAYGRGSRSPGEAKTDERARAFDRLQQSASVLAGAAREGRVPRGSVERSQCLAVVPAWLGGGLMAGVHHGSGVVTCRVGGSWSAPAFVEVTAVSADPKGGLESADVIHLVKTRPGLTALFASGLDVGADTEVVAYAGSRDRFAAVALSGLSMTQDWDATSAVYGGTPDADETLDGFVPARKGAGAFVLEMGAAFPAAR